MESYELSTPLTSPSHSPVLPRNASFHGRKQSNEQLIDQNDKYFELLFEDDPEDFSELPEIPRLCWWNPLHWKEIIMEPLNPPIVETHEPKSWYTYQRWFNYEYKYRSSLATQFSRILIFPSTFLSYMAIFEYKSIFTKDDLPSFMRKNMFLWRLIFFSFPVSIQILGEILYKYPFLLKGIHEILGFFAAVIPLYRLIFTKIPILTCIWLWYFSFYNSLMITSFEKQNILNRTDLCKKALMKTIDYIKWPISIVWILCVLTLGPLLSTGILTGLILKIVFGRFKTLYKKIYF
jgi:hypothetical protein